MYIDSLTLKNFKQHAALNLKFDKINVILGQNGRGKSSILEAITYGLYGTTASDLPKSKLLKLDQTSGFVHMKFSNSYQLYRDLGNKIELFDENEKKILNKATEIEQWLNISKKVFMDLLYAAQGEMYSFFVKFNATQKDFIDTLLIPDEHLMAVPLMLDKTIKALNEEYIRLNAQKTHYQNSVQFLDKLDRKSVV